MNTFPGCSDTMVGNLRAQGAALPPRCGYAYHFCLSLHIHAAIDRSLCDCRYYELSLGTTLASSGDFYESVGVQVCIIYWKL